ncbi:MAG: hypothetical protein Q9217_004380 [Psora testacea]
MGANLKRKEARKRIFASYKHKENAPTASSGDLEAKLPNKSQPNDSTASLEVIDSPQQRTGNGSAPEGDVRKGDAASKSQRFIVFIGNLPFTATDASISKHFAKVQPKSIRHRTDKVTGKSKCFAFLEFDGYDRMKACLKLYHHSSFDDGMSPARKLNVELTVGGGGARSTDRKAKLKEKNKRLSQQRQRRAQEEQHVKTLEADKETPTASAVNDGAVHPSRMSRVPAV